MRLALLTLMIFISGKLPALEVKNHTIYDGSVVNVCKSNVIAGASVSLNNYYVRKISKQLSSCKKETKIFLEIADDFSKKMPDGLEGYQLQEGFVVEVHEAITIIAATDEGLKRAIESLSAALIENNTIKKGVYRDYPDYQWRGVVANIHYLPCGDYAGKYSWSGWVACQEEYFQTLSKNKINRLGIYSDKYYSTSIIARMPLDKIKSLGDEYGVQVYPVLNTKLWGIPEDILPVDALEGISSTAVYQRQGNILADITPNRLIYNESFDKESRIGISNKVKGWFINRDNDATIVLTKASIPKLNTLVLTKSINDGDISITETSELEIAVRARSIGIKTQLSIYIEQFDEKGKIIVGYTYVPRIWINKIWQTRWVPQFISPAAKKIVINIIPKVLNGEKGEVEIDSVMIANVNGLAVNVLDNEETFPRVESYAGYQYKRGVDYNFKSSAIHELNGKEWEELPVGAFSVPQGSLIKPGEKVKVSFDRVSFMYRSIPLTKLSPYSKYTYDFYAGIAASLKSAGYQYIHLAMDEHMGGINRDSRSLAKNKSNSAIMSEFVSNLEKIITSKEEHCITAGQCTTGAGLNAKIIIWDDMFNPWHNGGNKYYLAAAGGPVMKTAINSVQEGESLSKSVILNSWWYQAGDKRGVIKKGGAWYSSHNYSFISSIADRKEVLNDWVNWYGPAEMLGIDATIWSAAQSEFSFEVGCVGWTRSKLKSCLLGRGQ